jgi:ApaG protein
MKGSSPKEEGAVGGLFVTLDQLQYSYRPDRAPEDRPHVFTYHLTIHNQSEEAVTILARKWVIRGSDGEIDVIEGDKVIGKTPQLAPGQSFSYASFHLVGRDAEVTGAFHGVNAAGNPVTVAVKAFDLKIPGGTGCN